MAASETAIPGGDGVDDELEGEALSPEEQEELEQAGRRAAALRRKRYTKQDVGGARGLADTLERMTGLGWRMEDTPPQAQQPRQQQAQHAGQQNEEMLRMKEDMEDMASDLRRIRRRQEMAESSIRTLETAAAQDAYRFGFKKKCTLREFPERTAQLKQEMTKAEEVSKLTTTGTCIMIRMKGESTYKGTGEFINRMAHRAKLQPEGIWVSKDKPVSVNMADGMARAVYRILKKYVDVEKLKVKTQFPNDAHGEFSMEMQKDGLKQLFHADIEQDKATVIITIHDLFKDQLDKRFQEEASAGIRHPYIREWHYAPAPKRAPDRNKAKQQGGTPAC